MSDITRDYSFGGWVRHFRIANEITLRQAADTMNMDPGNLSKLERSELAPPKDRNAVLRITRAIGLRDEEADLLISLAFQDHLAKLRYKFK